MLRIAVLIAVLTSLASFWPHAGSAHPAYDDPNTAAGWAWLQIRQDKIADFNERCGKLDPNVETGWDHLCRKIPPQFLVDVLTVPRLQDQLPRHRFRLRGALIDGTIDLANGEIGPEVWIDCSRIEGDLILTYSQWNRPLSFLNSALAGKFSASGMRSTSSVSISDHDVIGGELNLMSAKIDGTLNMETSSFMGNGERRFPKYRQVSAVK